MSKTFKQLYLELSGNIPKLPVDLAKTYINQAYQDARDSKLWGFLQDEGVLFSPSAISSGLIAVTQFSKNFQANATAITALNTLTNPVITKRQIRFSSGGAIYSVATYNSGTGAGTLNRIYRESTSSGTSYQLYRAYYGLPEDGTGNEVTDFVRYNKIYNPAISDWFRKINQPISILDQLDPQRSNSGNPYYLFIRDSINNIPQFEMWPHPMSSGTYIVNYQRKGVDLSADSDTLPFVLPDRMVMEKALELGCLWANKNQGRYLELKGSNWLVTAKYHATRYSNIDQRNPGMLEIAQRNDEELNPQSVIVDDYSYGNVAIGDDEKTCYTSIDA